ncbi:MAG: hypothetical protein SGPRY_007826 [Prymnesium sp.]
MAEAGLDQLLGDLSSLSGRVQQALRAEREALQEERRQLYRLSLSTLASLEAERWRLSAAQHDLDTQRSRWEELLGSIVDPSQQTEGIVTLRADCASLRCSLHSLTQGREPHSALAHLVRQHCPRVNPSAAEESPSPLSSGDPSISPVEREIFIDRDAAALQWVVMWLREGEISLASMPRVVLQAVGAEARHWQMRSLAEQVDERLGKPDASAEGREALEWFTLHLTRERDRLGVLRSLAKQLRHWLASGREPGLGKARRALAGHDDHCLPRALISALEAHASDCELLHDGFGCLILWSTSVEGRGALRCLGGVIHGLIDGADGVVKDALQHAADLEHRLLLKADLFAGSEQSTPLKPDATAKQTTMPETLLVDDVSGLPSNFNDGNQIIASRSLVRIDGHDADERKKDEEAVLLPERACRAVENETPSSELSKDELRDEREAVGKGGTHASASLALRTASRDIEILAKNLADTIERLRRMLRVVTTTG